jgi:NAD(P)-dependent dehydrogenase (short-subunit alcohol dehydrogenase family)
MGRLEGKVAFLTGGGAGIAKATALAFVREGAQVALAEIDEEAGKRAEREIGDAALFIRTDVTDDAGVARAIAAFGLFLASDESRMVNGTTIPADGGRSSYLRVYAE